MATNPPMGPGQGGPAGVPGTHQQQGGFTQGAVRAGGGSGGGTGDFAKPGKPFGGFMSSEFVTFLVTALAIAIAGLVSDELDSSLVWTLIAVLAFAFIVSRGLAKREDRGRDGGRF